MLQIVEMNALLLDLFYKQGLLLHADDNKSKIRNCMRHCLAIELRPGGDELLNVSIVVVNAYK